MEPLPTSKRLTELKERLKKKVIDRVKAYRTERAEERGYERVVRQKEKLARRQAEAEFRLERARAAPREEYARRQKQERQRAAVSRDRQGDYTSLFAVGRNMGFLTEGTVRRQQESRRARRGTQRQGKKSRGKKSKKSSRPAPRKNNGRNFGVNPWELW